MGRELISNKFLESVSIEALNLSVRAENALYRVGLNTIADLIIFQEKFGIRTIRNVGEKTANEIFGAIIDFNANNKHYQNNIPKEQHVNQSTECVFIVNGYPGLESGEIQNYSSFENKLLSIDVLNLDKRILNTLKRAEIYYVEKLLDFNDEQIRSIRGIGELAIRKIEEELSHYRINNKSSDESEQIKIFPTEKLEGLSEKDLKDKIKNLPSIKRLNLFTIEWTWKFFLKVTMSWQKTQIISNEIIEAELIPLQPLPDDTLLSHEIIRFLIEIQCPLEKIPSGRVMVDKKDQLLLYRLGIGSILDLILLRKEFLEKYDFSTEQIANNLDKYSSWLSSLVDWQHEIDGTQVSPIIIDAIREMDFENILELAIQGIESQRDKDIFVDYYQLNSDISPTYEQLGKKFNVTRERIRQILSRCEKVVNREIVKNKVLTALLDCSISMVEQLQITTFEELAAEIGEAIDIDNNELLKVLPILLKTTNMVYVPRSNEFIFINKTIYDECNKLKPLSIKVLRRRRIPLKFSTLVEEIINNEKFSLSDQHQKFLHLILEIDKTFQCLDEGYYGLSSWDNKILDDMVMVMREYQDPIHFKQLAKLVNVRLSQSKKTSERAVHGALGQNKDIFIRVGPGTFALKELNPNKRDQPIKYRELIKQALSKANKPLNFETIFEEVNKLRAAKKSSIFMYLTMHDDFIDYGNNKFGLSEWTKEKDGTENTQEKSNFSKDLVESMREKAKKAYQNKRKEN